MTSVRVGSKRTGPTPTITKPHLDEVRDVKPKALRPHKDMVLDWTIVCRTGHSNRRRGPRG